jgi:hypothetical protein
MTSSTQAFNEGVSRFLACRSHVGGGSSCSKIGSLAAVSRICNVGKNTAGRVNDDSLSFNPSKCPPKMEKNRICGHICVATAFGGARAATIFVAETIARPGQHALCLGVRHGAFAMRVRRRLVRRVGVTASLGAMFGASNVVLFAVMFGGGAMRLGRRFVKFGCLCIMSLGHNFSSMESLH